ncbi:uncharacterized protein ELE39_002284 [Cryptosporidium sp. chipmunk genotype I]|uniref:uncharacterized protein n=1 Tax=Cryptosporidium sp. chipmunk genotype I TaxID=1280935 RepID=UPI00351A9843|nr:hypothetical protein ELE39_002284 [Cryptosporidium sp. chipmunk genotype I]
MSNTVRTVTIINEQVTEVLSNLKTNKISEKLEDVSTKVNELLTNYLGKENDESSLSSQDEYQFQSDEEINGDKRSSTSHKSTSYAKSVNESILVEQSETSRGKRHKLDTSDK